MASKGVGYEIGQETILQYLADRQTAGVFADIQADGGTIPAGVKRPDAPAEFGKGDDDLWFSTPAEGSKRIRWMVNGVVRVERDYDLSVNRTVSVAELEAKAGDIVQVCVMEDGVVGWWGCYTL